MITLSKHPPGMPGVPVLIAMLYCWTQALVTGALLFDTFVLYPNVFGDVPRSLSAAMEFLDHASPASFLPGMGALSLVTALGALWVWRQHRWAFVCFLASFLLVVAFDFAASVLYFWPRNTIMFTEGLQVHAPETLITAAREFRAMHWVRVGASIIASFSAMAGLVVAAQHSARNG